MGDSMPPPAEFDLVDSFARVKGADAEIVFAEPKTELIDADQTVRLRQGGRTVDAPAEVVDSATGRQLIVRVPRSRISDGIWSLSVVRNDDGVAPLAARLLVQGRRPLVLLWGAEGAKTLEPASRRSPARQRVVTTGKHVLDRALSVLPDERAAAVRKQARTAARRLLG